MTPLHRSIADIDMPPQIADLPRSRQGYPVPWFVAHIDGDPDFRAIRPDGVNIATRHALCWLCGHELGMTATYVAGPMCGINRTSAEPPSHHRCADYAAQACPFLARPHAVRRGAPEGADPAAGVMLDRNPGVAMLWRCPQVPHPFDDGRGGTLFRLPNPIRVDWICKGRPATFMEVDLSIQTGLPALREAAAQDGPGALAHLHDAIVALYPHLPPRPKVAA